MVASPSLMIRDPEFSGLVGVARADINPPPGIFARCWGAARHDVANGLHKPLLASCIAFSSESGGPPLVLLALDLSWWNSKDDELGLRTKILERAGLEETQLMMHVSHTHSAPRTALEFADKPGGQFIAPYRAKIIETSVRLIKSAVKSLRPATLTWKAGECALAFNRDLPGPDGRILCGINPAAKADTTLLVGRVSDASGKMVCTLVNYACHPISLGAGNTLVSSDYVGAMRETIEAETGGAPCVFLHGASGDQAPRRCFESDPAVADQNGKEVGFAALTVLSSMLAPRTALAFSGVEESGTPLAVWRTKAVSTASVLAARRLTVRLTIADMPTEEELVHGIQQATEGYIVERLTRRLLARRSLGSGPEGDFTFSIWHLGDSFMVGTPAEMHTAFQRRLRASFPSAAIPVLNIVNGYASYLPPREDFPIAAYPVRVSYYGIGSMEKVLEAATGGIRELLGDSVQGDPAAVTELQ